MIVRETQTRTLHRQAPATAVRHAPLPRSRVRHDRLLMIGSFSILVIALDWGLFALLDRAFQHVETGVFGGIVNDARHARADVVVLGTSRAWHHYDTAILRDRLGRSAYNAGCAGQGLPYMRGVMDLILLEYTPALFIIDVDAFLVRPPNPYLDRATVLAPFIDESEVVRELIYSRGPFERLKYLPRSFRYNGRALVVLRDAGRPNRSDAGYEPVDATMDAARARTAVEPSHPDVAPDPRDLELLRDMIRAGQAAGSRVVLVRSPRYFHDIQDAFAPCPMIDAIRRVASQEQVPFLSITHTDAPELHDPSFFVDPSHLNRHGARVFTQALAERLDEIGLREALLPDDLPVASARPK